MWLDDLITSQMRETGLPRSSVIQNLLQVRPEIAKYLNDLERSRAPKPTDDLSLRDTARQLGKILDLLSSLAKNTGEGKDSSSLAANNKESHDESPPWANFQPSTFEPEPGSISTRDSRLKTPDSPDNLQLPPTPDSRLQTQDSQPQSLSMFQPKPAKSQQPVGSQQQSPQTADDPPTQDSRLQTQDFSALDEKYRLVFSTLSLPDGEPRRGLRFRDIIQEWINTYQFTEAEAIDAICDRAIQQPWLFGSIISDCISEYQQMRSDDLIPEPTTPSNRQPSTFNLQPATCNLQLISGPARLRASVRSQFLSMFQPKPPKSQQPVGSQRQSPQTADDPPTPDSRLQTLDSPATPDSRLQTQDCEGNPPPSPCNLQPSTSDPQPTSSG